MTQCVKIRRTSKKVCIGAMNRKIDILVRTIQSPTGSRVDFDEEFVPLKTVWAMVESVGAKVFFDGTNTEQVTTHNFYIRFIPGEDITAANWIKFSDQYYDIVGVENLNEESLFYLLRTTVRGTITKPVNFSS